MSDEYIKWPKYPASVAEYFTKPVIDGVPEEIICIEECSELQKELTKSLRGKANREHIIEELTDVFLTLNDLRAIYSITLEEVEQVYASKFKRFGFDYKDF